MSIVKKDAHTDAQRPHMGLLSIMTGGNDYVNLSKEEHTKVVEGVEDAIFSDCDEGLRKVSASFFESLV